MAYETLGADDFKKGLQIYMKRHAYGNTITTDLWSAWSEASGRDVNALMRSWTEQMGYPLLEVSASGEVSQRWFLADGSKDEGAEKKAWSVPLFVSRPGAAAAEEVGTLLPSQASMQIPKFESSPYVIVNAGQKTMSRVLYPAAMYKSLAAACASGAIGPVDRVAIVSDAFALAKIGEVTPSTLLTVLDSFSGETEHAVWETISIAIATIDKALQGGGQKFAALAEKFRAWAAKLASPALERVGWDSDPAKDGHLGTMLRSLLVSLVGRVGATPAVVAEARKRFAALMAQEDKTKPCALLPPDLKAPVFKIVLKAAETRAEYDQLRAVLSDNEDMAVAEKKLIYAALGSASDPKLKLATLEWALHEVKLQDFFYPMLSVQNSGAAGSDIAWQFCQDNIQVVADKLASASPSLLDAVVKCTARGTSTFERADEVDAFFKSDAVAPRVEKITTKLAQMLENMRNDAKFLGMLSELETGFFKA